MLKGSAKPFEGELLPAKLDLAMLCYSRTPTASRLQEVNHNISTEVTSAVSTLKARGGVTKRVGQQLRLPSLEAS